MRDEAGTLLDCDVHLFSLPKLNRSVKYTCSPSQAANHTTGTK